MVKSKKSAGRPSTITPEVLSKLETAYRSNCTDVEACNFADITTMSLYRYQKANPDFVSKKARWKKGLKGRAKMAIAMKIFGGDSKTSQWYIEHEERAEMNKANVKRLQAETKRTLAEAQMAEYKAKILEGGRSTDINIQIGGDDDSN